MFSIFKFFLKTINYIEVQKYFWVNRKYTKKLLKQNKTNKKVIKERERERETSRLQMPSLDPFRKLLTYTYVLRTNIISNMIG